MDSEEWNTGGAAGWDIGRAACVPGVVQVQVSFGGVAVVVIELVEIKRQEKQ